MLGGKRGWVRSRKGDPIQHNAYPRLAVTWKPQLGSKAAGALQWDNDPGDIEWGHIFLCWESQLRMWNVNASVLIAVSAASPPPEPQDRESHLTRW